MFCKNCGKSIADNVKFCASCGNAVSAQVADAPKQAVAEKNFLGFGWLACFGYSWIICFGIIPSIRRV